MIRIFRHYIPKSLFFQGAIEAVILLFSVYLGVSLRILVTDTGMGGFNWIDFGRQDAAMLFTEDWFGDEMAPQWSFYCAKLRCAARLGNVDFGGYVIPRTAGSRENGILQKILSITAHGGKAIKYFVFGPEYVFPGNCYSFRSRLLPKMAEAHDLIARAEHLLWPGKIMPRGISCLISRNEVSTEREEYDSTRNCFGHPRKYRSAGRCPERHG